ncbi:site-specific integrase [Streptomyces sp. BR123]|uniref:tyrosine-type recombinase/integrase n=1 Tax=Streptomyces sp. BR123 TaxID=2749828 RepID=UPI0015C4A554|nr:site-specific integrase [Streptomyces sp. BR123]NXY96393.1 site-specific integrase [Streptomyces sp. BR123]
MAGYIEDRWLTKRPDPVTGKKRKTALYGQGKRYKVTGIPGVRSRSFDQLGGPNGANAWKAKAQADSMRGEFIDPRDGNITLREYFTSHYWPTKTGDPGTLRTVETRVRVRILPHLGDHRLNAIRVPQLRALLAELDGSYSPSTIIETWGTLSSILQAAVDDERIAKNPCLAKSVGPPSKPERKARAWSRERVKAVREGLDERFRVMLDLGVGAGLRQGEVLGLSVDDIDEVAEVIHVRRQVRVVHNRLVFSPPKGGKTRAVPLPSNLAARITAHRKAYPPITVALPWVNPDAPGTAKQAEERAPQTHDLLVSGPRGKGALRRSVFNEGPWKRALLVAGVIPPPPPREKGQRSNTKYASAPEDGFHALRHTFASVQLHERESVVSVAKWLGHSDPSITLKIYAHMMPEADGRGRKAMDAWLEGLS